MEATPTSYYERIANFSGIKSRKLERKADNSESKDGVDIFSLSFTGDIPDAEFDEAKDDAVSEFNIDCRRDQILRDQANLYKKLSFAYKFGVSDGPYLRHLNDSASNHTWTCVTTIICPVSGVVFAVAGGDSNLISVWDLESGAIDCQLVGHTDKIWGIACMNHISSKSAILVSCSADKQLILWDWEKKSIKQKLLHHTDVIWAVGVADVNHFHKFPIVISGGRDRNCVISCSETGKLLKILSHLTSGHTAGIRTVAVAYSSPESPVYIITGSNDANIILWDLFTGDINCKLSGHAWSVLSVSCYYIPGHSEPIIVSGSVDKNILLWDVPSRSIARKINMSNAVGMVTSVIVNKSQNGDQPCIFAADATGIVRIFDLRSGALMRQLIVKSEINAMIVNDSAVNLGEVIITAGKGGVNVFDLAASDTLRNFRSGCAGPVEVCALYLELRKTHSCGAVLASAGATSKIVLWDNNNVRMHNLIGGHTARVSALEFNHPIYYNERILLASGGWDFTICIWDVMDGQLQRKLLGHDDRVFSLAFVNKLGTHYLLSGAAFHEQDNVILWNVNAGTKECRKLFSNSNVYAVIIYIPSPEIVAKSSAWSADSIVIVSASEDTKLYVYDVHSKCMQIFTSSKQTHVPVALDVIVCMVIQEYKDAGMVYLIGGGHANIIILWDLLTGDVLHEFYGHSDSITTLSFIQNPNYMNGAGIIVSGSADSTVKLWDMDARKLVQTKTSHRHRVLLVAGVSRTDKEFPFLCSACIDKICYIHDLSYDCSALPPRGHVGRCFENDRILQDGKWPRIEKLSNLYGDMFWLDNAQLVTFAVWYKEVGFIVKFHDRIRKSLCRVRDTVDENSSFMEYCISYGSIILIKLVLHVWAEELNRAIVDFAQQHYFHLAYQIQTKDLLLLAQKFPTEFCEFICAIRIRPAHKSVYPDAYRLDLGDSGIQIASCCQSFYQDLWTSLVADNESQSSQDRQPITVYFVPLLNMTDIRILRAFVETSIKLESVNLLNSDVGEIALRAVWRSCGKRIHVHSFKVYIVYVLLYAFDIYSFEFLIQYSTTSIVICWITQISLIVFTLYYVYDEIRQARSGENSLFGHIFNHMWNAIDFMSIIAVLIGTIWRLCTQRDSMVSRCSLAIASIFIWFKVLYFVRAFASSGPLVSMIIRIAWNIRFFCLVLFLTIIGFSQAFWLLSNPFPGSNFGTIHASLLNTFLYMLGNFSSDFSETANPTLATIILVCFLMFMTILMLNLLIALMGQSFSEVQANGLGQWRLELASTITDLAYLLSEEDKHSNKCCLFVMKYTSSLTIQDILESFGELTSNDISSAAQNNVVAANKTIMPVEIPVVDQSVNLNQAAELHRRLSSIEGLLLEMKRFNRERSSTNQF